MKLRSPVLWRHGAVVCAALAVPPLAAQVAAPVTAPAGTDETRFDVLEYVIDGNTVLSVERVEQAVTPFLGPGLSMARVEAARAALEKAYQDAGYLSVFVDVPEPVW